MMALTKRTYVDGETIITAQNLNDIQDEIIAHETNKVPITRTVNGKALSSNITLNASDVGAVPTTRTVNGNALSSNVTINASDIPNDSAVSGTNIDDALDNLNTAINKMGAISANTKALLIGDSYNYGVGGTSGRGWGYYLQQMTGCTATIIHQNGGGFAVAGNSNASYPNKTYAELVDSLSESADYDLVIVQSGWNDASLTTNTGGASAIETGVSDFIDAIKEKYANAKLIIIPCYNDYYPLNQQQFRLLTIAQTAAKNGVKTCFDSFLWMQNSGYNSQDNIHLTDDGYQLLAKYMFAFLSGWDGIITFEKDITSQITKNTITGVTLGNNFHVFVTKDMCYASGDVSLTETVSSWTEIVSGVPSPNLAIITTAFQWQADFKRPMRQGTWGNGLQIRYGESGNYRFDMIYPINHISDTTPG